MLFQVLLFSAKCHFDTLYNVVMSTRYASFELSDSWRLVEFCFSLSMNLWVDKQTNENIEPVFYLEMESMILVPIKSVLRLTNMYLTLSIQSTPKVLWSNKLGYGNCLN